MGLEIMTSQSRRLHSILTKSNKQGRITTSHRQIKFRGKVGMKDLFNDIVRYGVFMADYEFVDNEGEAVRIRVARYLLKMYFIVQRGGEIVELHQI